MPFAQLKCRAIDFCFAGAKNSRAENMTPPLTAQDTGEHHDAGECGRRHKENRLSCTPAQQEYRGTERDGQQIERVSETRIWHQYKTSHEDSDHCAESVPRQQPAHAVTETLLLTRDNSQGQRQHSTYQTGG